MENNTFNPGSQTLQIRSANAEKREITAIGVPYNQVINIWDWEEGLCKEQFAPGSINAEGAILRYGHSDPIGKIISSRDTNEGFEITAIISKTDRGNEVWQLIKDEVLTRMSIGFIGHEKTISYDDDENTLITWTKVEAREFSVVEFPAYSEAKIIGARNEENITQPPLEKEKPMENTVNTEINGLSERLEIVERAMSTIGEKKVENIPTFRSFGEYVHAAMSGDESARMFHERATQDSTKLAGHNPWLGTLLDRMAAKQPVINMFTRTVLPATGLNMDYVQKKDPSTITVDRQTTEGTDLAAGSIGSWEAKSVPIHTYGGVTDPMTRQLIERATSINVLDEVFSDLAFAYASDLEKDFKTLFEATYTSQLESPTVETSLTMENLTISDVLDIFEDLSDAYDDTPHVMDGVAVSQTMFRALRNLAEKKTAFQPGGADANKAGIYKGPTTGTLVLHDGTLIKRVKGWSGNHMTGYTARALTLAEEAGAPTRLQDEHIKNLSKIYAVYGYGAMYAPRPQLIMPVKLAG